VRTASLKSKTQKHILQACMVFQCSCNHWIVHINAKRLWQFLLYGVYIVICCVWL